MYILDTILDTMNSRISSINTQEIHFAVRYVRLNQDDFN